MLYIIGEELWEDRLQDWQVKVLCDYFRVNAEKVNKDKLPVADSWMWHVAVEALPCGFDVVHVSTFPYTCNLGLVDRSAPKHYMRNVEKHVKRVLENACV